MSNALLAHVQVTDAARFDMEQKVLGGVPLTQDDAELLLVIAQQTTDDIMAEMAAAEVDVEQLEDNVEKATRRAEAAEAQMLAMTINGTMLHRKITALGAQASDLTRREIIECIAAILADVDYQTKGG